jgi:predicted permease
VDVDAASRGYTGERLASLTRKLTDAARRVPGVSAVSFSENGLFSGTESATTLEVPGFTPRIPGDTLVNYDGVGPAYFQTLRAQIIRGREFGSADQFPGSFVAVVNERMARFYWQGNAIGKSIRFGDTLTVQIVGIVRDITDHQLGADTVSRLYLSYHQGAAGRPESMRLEVRTAGDPRLVAASLRTALKTVDQSLPIGQPEALSDLMRQSVREQRLVARLATGFGVLAVLLAAIGLYGVMSYAVTRRTGEIGLRVALGADRERVVGLILSDALKVVGIGLVVGIPVALAATRLLRSQLHGVHPADPVVMGAALVVLTVSAIVAALIPAMRASRIDPLVALRQE